MATYFDLISENDESTVVAQFEHSYMMGERPYMSEKALEAQFIEQLQSQQYEYVSLTTETELIANLRRPAGAAQRRDIQRRRMETILYH